MIAVGPLRKSLTVDQMVEEQGYKPINKEDFFEKTDKIKWDESLEELLEMLD